MQTEGRNQRFELIKHYVQAAMLNNNWMFNITFIIFRTAKFTQYYRFCNNDISLQSFTTL